ncbi:hypothetical protein QBC35DRAFT_220861 [Podospora australis]|uniref:Uncharacterized protein n=1 Tax=Podospora australis TaxID=1536484 RepID=A0AAN6WU42_9PEZI|nr:hypothetical protein QBC35DRAFT_220861 [Podospora australis]
MERCRSDVMDRSRCGLHHDISAYTAEFGFYGLTECAHPSPDTWPRPGGLYGHLSLNISAFYLFPGKDELFGHHWVDPRTGQMPFQDQSKITFAANNQTYSLDYIRANGRCQAVNDRFRWGFSYIQLFVLIHILLLWTTGFLILQSRTEFLFSESSSKYSTGLKGVSQLASMMAVELRAASINPGELTDTDFRIEVTIYLKGGHVWVNKRAEHWHKEDDTADSSEATLVSKLSH